MKTYSQVRCPACKHLYTYSTPRTFAVDVKCTGNKKDGDTYRGCLQTSPLVKWGVGSSETPMVKSLEQATWHHESYLSLSQSDINWLLSRPLDVWVKLSDGRWAMRAGPDIPPDIRVVDITLLRRRKTW